MAEQDYNHEMVRVARTVTLKPLSGTLVLVATNAKGTLRIDAFAQFKKSYLCKVLRGVMDVS